MEIFSRFNAQLADLSETLDQQATYEELHAAATALTFTAEELAGLLPTVYVLTIEHDDGTNVSVHLTRETAELALYAFVDAWWEDELYGVPMPEGREQTIRDYFDKMDGEEAWAIEAVELT